MRLANSCRLCTFVGMAVDASLIRLRRDELDLSNADLARVSNVNPRYLRNIVCGANQPSRRVIFRLARALELEPEKVDPDIYAGKRTPRGDPSEPPIQPKNEPKSPPTRRDHEGDRKGPPRVSEVAA